MSFVILPLVHYENNIDATKKVLEKLIKCWNACIQVTMHQIVAFSSNLRGDSGGFLLNSPSEAKCLETNTLTFLQN